MPLPKGTHYAIKQTAKGPVRLAYGPDGDVIEAVNLKTKARHSPAEFAADRAAPGPRGKKK